MKQLPSKYIYKKCHKTNYSYIYLVDKKNFFAIKGQYAFQSLWSGKLLFKQIEACRRTIKRLIKNFGFLFIRVFTGIQITKKPLSSRMGKGKGSISHWVSIIKKGQIIFEISGISDIMANIIFNRCRKQLPLKLKLIKLFF